MDFLFVHLPGFDSLLHAEGSQSLLIPEYLSKLDNSIKETCEYFQNKYGEINIIVTSDHGMADIKGVIDL